MQLQNVVSSLCNRSKIFSPFRQVFWSIFCSMFEKVEDHKVMGEKLKYL